MKLPTIRSKRFTISIKANNKTFKLFKIIFHTGKYSKSTQIFIDFPYFKHSKGLISKLTHPANKKSQIDLSLVPTGKVTSHLVKYSHPIDGNAHFSGDGKIITSIRNQSKRLDNSVGHLFTIQTQGLDDFELKKDAKSLTEKEIDLDFSFTDEITGALKFTAWWHKPTDLKGTIKNDGPMKAQFSFREPNGTFSNPGFIISPPANTPLADYVLLLLCQGIPLLNETGASTFSFIGGFDPVSSENADFHFLSCLYPTDNYDSLLKQIGTVDYNPPSPLDPKK